MVHKAKDLSPDQKMVVESLLGRRVLEDDAISIHAFEPLMLSQQDRQEVAEKLQNYFAAVDANHKPASPQEIEEAFTEAMRSSRPGYRSHQ